MRNINPGDQTSGPPANPNPSRGRNRDGSAQPVQLSRAQHAAHQFQQGSDPVFVGPEQQDAAVSSRRVSANVSEPLVRSDEEAPLGLHRRPEHWVLRAAEALAGDGFHLMPGPLKQCCYLKRQVFIDLDRERHRLARGRDDDLVPQHLGGIR